MVRRDSIQSRQGRQKGEEEGDDRWKKVELNLPCPPPPLTPVFRLRSEEGNSFVTDTKNEERVGRWGSSAVANKKEEK